MKAPGTATMMMNGSSHDWNSTTKPEPQAPEGAEHRLHLAVPAMPTVVEGGRVHLRPVEPGLDDGKSVQIVQGRQAGQTVALDLPAEVTDGAQVQVVPLFGAPGLHIEDLGVGGSGTPVPR